MDKEEISALLGRPLTTVEDTNFNLYINIANENLQNLICTPFEEITETRLFGTRHDYKTAFVDIFSEVTEVKLDDTVTTDYQIRQWDNLNGNWFNSLVFEDYLKGKKLEVTASWGFPPASDASSLPLDLQQVLAGLFGLISKKNKYDGSIQSKQVEDFRITLRDVDLDDEFYKSYGTTISKYSLCNIPDFKQGKVCQCSEDCKCWNR
jgi:hypothetical protein